MIKWNRKHWTYVLLNWTLAFVIFAVVFYFTPFGAQEWTWTKYGLSILLYFVSGLVSSIALSIMMKYWKHWKWANVLFYRPITAFLSATILAIGFGWLFTGVLTWDKSLAWLLITKLFVIGFGKGVQLFGQGKVETKFARDLLEVC